MQMMSRPAVVVSHGHGAKSLTVRSHFVKGSTQADRADWGPVPTSVEML